MRSIRMSNTVAVMKGLDSQMEEIVLDQPAAALAGKVAVSPAEWLGWCGLALVLVGGVPLFLRMPLWADPIQYDIAARNVLRGGMHYRDVFDVNLPGMVWLHAAIRGLFG